MTNTESPHPFDVVLQKRFKGVLLSGKHAENGKACTLEAASAARGLPWSDDPGQAGLPDLRPINDGPWSSDSARTEAMASAVRALWGWPDWTEDQREAVVRRVLLRHVTEVLPIALESIGLADNAAQCREAVDLDSAGHAAYAAYAAAYAARAAYAAYAAAYAARAAGAAYAAYAARAAGAVYAAYAARAARAAGTAARAAGAAAGAYTAGDRVLSLACRIWVEEAGR